jgi:transposase
MHYIEEENRQQSTMGFSLNEIISCDNAVRIIDALVDEIYKNNKERFDIKGQNEIGRKAYKPTTLLKLYLYGYINSISSSRKLEAETYRNIEMMWLLGNLKPDHKTISDYRKDNNDSIRFVTIEFRRFLKSKGYIDGKVVGVDGSKLKANANRDMLTLKKIEKRTHKLEEQLEKYLAKLSSNDKIDDIKDEIDNKDEDGNIDEHLLNKILSLQEHIEKLEKEKKFLEETNRKCCSPADHDAMLMKTRDGKVPAYNLEAAVDNKNKMIAVAEVVTDCSDINQLEPTLNRLKGQIEIVPDEVPSDKGFYNINQIINIESSGKTKCYVPPTEDKAEKKDKEAEINFKYDNEKREYTCSKGKKLVLISRNKKRRSNIVDVYQCKDCYNCKIKSKCTKSKVGRIVHRHKEQQWLDSYKSRMKGAKAKLMMKLRKKLVEHPFGTIKYWMGKIPILLRGKLKVQTEIDIYSTCYNLKRLINIENHKILIQMIRNYNWKVA